MSEGYMSEKEFRVRVIQSLEFLIQATKHYGEGNGLTVTCSYADGVVWQVSVREVPMIAVSTIMPPARVRFSQN